MDRNIVTARDLAQGRETMRVALIEWLMVDGWAEDYANDIADRILERFIVIDGSPR